MRRATSGQRRSGKQQGVASSPSSCPNACVRRVQMPTLVPNVSAVDAAANSTFARDPATGQWYECNSYYSIYVCSKCKGMQLRCQADLGTKFRCAWACLCVWLLRCMPCCLNVFFVPRLRAEGTSPRCTGRTRP